MIISASIKVLVAAVALVALPAAAPFASPSKGPTCPVTPPPRGLKGLPRSTGEFSASDFNFGNARIRVELWPHASLVAGTLPGGASYARILSDGSIYAKLGWWRGVPGRLAIRG